MSDDGVRSRSFAGAVAAGAAAVAVMSGVAKADATVRASSIEGPVAYGNTVTQFGGGGGQGFQTSGGTPFSMGLTVSNNRLVLDTSPTTTSGSGGGGAVKNASRIAGIAPAYNYGKSVANRTATTLKTAGGEVASVGVGLNGSVLTITGGQPPGPQNYTAVQSSQLTATNTKLSVSMSATTTGGTASNGTMKMYTSGQTYSTQTPTIKTGFSYTFTDTNSFTSPTVSFYASHTSQQPNITSYSAGLFGADTATQNTTLAGQGTKLALTMTGNTTGGAASNGTMKMYTSGQTYSAQTPTIKTGFSTVFTNTTAFNSPVVTFRASHTTTTVSIQSTTASLYSADTAKQSSALTGTGTNINATMTANTTGGTASKGYMRIYTSQGNYSKNTSTIKSNFTAGFTDTNSFTSPTVSFYASHPTTTVTIGTNYAASLTGGGGGGGSVVKQDSTNNALTNTNSVSLTATVTATKVVMKAELYSNYPYHYGSWTASVNGAQVGTVDPNAKTFQWTTTASGTYNSPATASWHLTTSLGITATIRTRTATFYY